MSESKNYPGFRWIVLVLVVLGTVGMQLVNLSIAPLIPTIAGSLGTDPGTAAMILLTSFLISGCVIWILGGGYICDKFGVFVALTIGLLCLAVPASLMHVFGTSGTGLCIARIIQGLSSGLIFPCVPTIVNTIFPDKQKSLANALLNSSVAVGSALGPIAGANLNRIMGSWQSMSVGISVYLWIAVVLVVIGYFAFNSRMPKMAPPPADTSGDSAFKKALFSPFTILGICCFFFAAWGMQCLYGLTATYLGAGAPLGIGKGDLTASNLMLGVTLLGGVTGPFVGTFLMAKCFKGSAKSLMLLGNALMAVTLYLLMSSWFTGSIVRLETILIICGFGLMFVFPTIYFLIAISYQPQIIGRMSGLWGGIGSFGGVAGTAVAGWTISKTGTYNATLTVQSFVAVLSFVLVVLLFKARQSFLKANEKAAVPAAR
jgi:MFS family permease